jgi:opacity protein-like surface antigen
MICLALAVAAIAWIAAGLPSADAEELTTVRPAGRGGTWDVYLPFNFAESATIDGQNGSRIDVNAGTGFGFGAGYNFNEHFQVNGLFSWNVRSFDAMVITNAGTTQQYSNYMNTSLLMVSGVVYFLKGNLTPFVSGGIGIAKVDANIEGGPGTGAYVPSRTENDMSYSAGIGVRYDVSRQFSLQGSYNKAWIDMSKASSVPDFGVWRLDLLFPM